MIDLDIRLGINGIRLDNKPEVIKDIQSTLSDCADVLDIPCETKEAYKLYKDIRKQLKDDRKTINDSIKEKLKSYTDNLVEDQKELSAMFDTLYNNIDNAIKAYEEQNEIGAAKAKITRAANKAAKEIEAASLTLTLACPSDEVKQRIIQFATDLGATII